jgi:hypothetical protein
MRTRFPWETHAVLTLLTCGLWLPAWVLLWVLSVLTVRR